MIFYKTVLTRQIYYDIVKKGFFTIFCFVLLLVVAVATILITQSSRQLVTQHEQLLIEKDKLETEWQNQLLEENVLTEHITIENKATKQLDMVRPTLADEVIVKEKSLEKSTQ